MELGELYADPKNGEVNEESVSPVLSKKTGNCFHLPFKVSVPIALHAAGNSVLDAFREARGNGFGEVADHITA